MINTPLPNVQIKTLDGKPFNTSSLANNSKPMLLVFWATWHAPSKKVLDTFQENLETWVPETGVKVIACAADDPRTSPKVGPTLAAKSWDAETYLDENGDLQRAMNVKNLPHTFLINGAGEVVWEHNDYTPGDETKLYQALGKVARGEPLT